jgi:hypothetical protein
MVERREGCDKMVRRRADRDAVFIQSDEEAL